MTCTDASVSRLADYLAALGCSQAFDVLDTNLADDVLSRISHKISDVDYVLATLVDYEGWNTFQLAGKPLRMWISQDVWKDTLSIQIYSDVDGSSYSWYLGYGDTMQAWKTNSFCSKVNDHKLSKPIVRLMQTIVERFVGEEFIYHVKARAC